MQSNWEEYRTNDVLVRVKVGYGTTEFVIGQDCDTYFKMEREEAIRLAHQIIRHDWTP